MSIVPQATGIVSSAAGAPLSQNNANTERAGREGAATDRTRSQAQAALAAAGIGKTDADQETSDRDADGRRLWEAPAGVEESESQAEEQEPRRPTDPKGESGNALDLIG